MPFMEFREPSEWVPLKPGDYTRAQVHAPGSPANCLMHHLPKHNQRYKAVRVNDDGLVIGVVMSEDVVLDAPSVAVASPCTGCGALVPIGNRFCGACGAEQFAPESKPVVGKIEEPVKVVAESEPVAVSSMGYPALKRLCVEHGLTGKGTRSELVASLHATGVR